MKEKQAQNVYLTYQQKKKTTREKLQFRMDGKPLYTDWTLFCVAKGINNVWN